MRLPDFFAGVWEVRPLLVRRRHAPTLFASLLSSGAIRSELQAGLEYTLDVDVVHYNGLVRSICMPRCCCIDAQRSSQLGSCTCDMRVISLLTLACFTTRPEGSFLVFMPLQPRESAM